MDLIEDPISFISVLVKEMIEDSVFALVIQYLPDEDHFDEKVQDL